MSILFLIIAGILGAVGGIRLLIVMFQESILWGIGSMILPFVSLIFVITHWEESKKPFLIQMAAIPFIILGVMLS